MTKKKAPGRSEREGLSLPELFAIFPDDATAEKWFEKQRWPNGIACPECGSLRYAVVKNRKPMPYRCKDCRKYFSVRKGMVMQSSKLGYQKWAIAIYLVATSLKGISSMKLHRELKVRQPTAWHLAQRIREGFVAGRTLMSGPVEVDETYFGGKRRNMNKAKRAELEGRGATGKAAVVGAKDRITKQVSVKVVNDTGQETLQGFVRDNAAPGAQVYTDGSSSSLGMDEYGHDSVNHSVGEYVKGQVHTNGIESLWSMLKRGYVGTYHKMSFKHLHRYVNEFAGRQNIREFGTLKQMALLVRGMDGKVLHYKDLIAE